MYHRSGTPEVSEKKEGMNYIQKAILFLSFFESETSFHFPVYRMDKSSFSSFNKLSFERRFLIP